MLTEEQPLYRLKIEREREKKETSEQRHQRWHTPGEMDFTQLV